MRRREASQEPLGTLLWAPLGLASEAGKGSGLAGWPSWPLGSAGQQGFSRVLCGEESPGQLPQAHPREEEGEANSFLGGEGLKVPLRSLLLVCPGEGLILCPTCRVPGPAAVVPIQQQQLC